VFERRTVEEQAAECNQGTDDCEEAGKEARRGARTKCEAVHTRKIARSPDCDDGKPD
jgi:hypothetical protein